MGMYDMKRAGRSKLVPYREDEHASDRHARRLTVNLSYEADVRAWCEARGLALKIGNEGHHWTFKRPTDGWVAEWWPSSAKLVIGRRYDNGIHVHDWTQATRIMERKLDGKKGQK